MFRLVTFQLLLLVSVILLVGCGGGNGASTSTTHELNSGNDSQQRFTKKARFPKPPKE